MLLCDVCYLLVLLFVVWRLLYVLLFVDWCVSFVGYAVCCCVVRWLSSLAGCCMSRVLYDA